MINALGNHIKTYSISIVSYHLLSPSVSTYTSMALGHFLGQGFDVPYTGLMYHTLASDKALMW